MKVTNIIQRMHLHASTVIRMKPGQVFRRLSKHIGMNCAIGCQAGSYTNQVHPIIPIPELDLDPIFLARFSTEELMKDSFTFLHSTRHLDPDGEWNLEEETPLWNFNLHYFEFLFPLWNAFQTTRDTQFLNQAFRLMTSWIRQNSLSGKGAAWESYTIALRVTNWLSFLSLAGNELSVNLRDTITCSLYEQYVYLSQHLEKDILGNHYFEDLKALVLCAVFFRDDTMLRHARHKLARECDKEILKDGMHFELSPMYHNLILEGLLKVTAALRESGQADAELESYLQPMLDAAWSLEGMLNRIPLFNDSGNNVAKSLSALLAAAKKHFDLVPVYKSEFPDAGYYIFQNSSWKMIVDAGQPGPSYIPGHAHCDALSFELFKDGNPVAVNCGTYAYQSDLRGFFRSTPAHNTVMINGREQSECWSIFRMAGRSTVRVLSADAEHLSAEMKDYTGQTVKRTFQFGKELVITDETENGSLTSYLHILAPLDSEIICEQTIEHMHPYADEYGECTDIRAIEYKGERRICLRIRLDD